MRLYEPKELLIEDNNENEKPDKNNNSYVYFESNINARVVVNYEYENEPDLLVLLIAFQSFSGLFESLLKIFVLHWLPEVEQQGSRDMRRWM